jgi:hypothetical protein
MMLLCTGMAIDSLPVTQSLVANVADHVTMVFSEVPIMQVTLPTGA